MIRFLLVLLGLVGAAGVGAGVYLYLTDGGLALALYDRDAPLMALEGEQRVAVFDTLGDVIDGWAARARKSEADDGANDDGPNGTGGKKTKPLPVPPPELLEYLERMRREREEAMAHKPDVPDPPVPVGSAGLKEITDLGSDALEKFSLGAEKWRNRGGTADMRAALADAVKFIDVTAKHYGKLTPDDQASAREMAQRVKHDIFNEVASGKGLYSRARDDDKQITELVGKMRKQIAANEKLFQ